MLVGRHRPIVANDGQPVCACGARSWQPLPDPLPDRSITTDGHILAQPLAKAQCGACGLLRRLNFDRAVTEFYEKDYAFYDRPGAESFDSIRYRGMAAWVLGALGDFTPRHVAEVGCGNGWTLRAMRELCSHACFTGIEPSERAALTARDAGLSVIRAAAGIDELPPDATFDLIYSNNVIEHTAEPLGFLLALKQMLQPGGRLVISCPDGTLPAADMMFSDHLFTFAPVHLVRLVRRAGLVPLAWHPCPAGTGLRNEQLIVAATDRDFDVTARMPRVEATLPTWDSGSMLRARMDYLSRWAMVDDYLSEAIVGAKRVYNFGAGEWGFLLAGYAPRTWSQVEACTVDGYEGEFMGKKVVPYGSIGDRVDAVIVGINPDAQRAVASRLGQQGHRAVTWQHLVAR